MDNAEILAAWGCPRKYLGADSSPPATWLLPEGFVNFVAAVEGAANWYPEMNSALRRMVLDGDSDAVAEWGDSAAWEDIADDGDAETAEDYVSAVRGAFAALAEAMAEAGAAR